MYALLLCYRDQNIDFKKTADILAENRRKSDPNMDPWFSKSKNFLGRWIFAATKVKRKKRKKLTGGRNSKKVLLTPTYNLPLNEVLGIKVTQPLDIFFRSSFYR
jgi:hypothetical protein